MARREVSPEDHGLSVIIVGAGTTGLLLAQGLQSAKIPVRVYERLSLTNYDARSRDWGMSLNMSHAAITRLLPPALRARINECRCDPHAYDNQIDKAEIEKGMPQYAGHSGEELFRVKEEDALRVSRRKMRRLFSEGLDVQYGKRLISITQEDAHVRAIFDDGHVAGASLIVGCDGAKSVVRELLVGKEESELTFLDISLFNFSCKFDAETAKLIRAQHPVSHTAYHRNGWMLSLATEDATDLSKPETWAMQVMFSYKGGPKREDFERQADRTEFLRSKASEFAEPWRTILGKIPDEAAFDVDKVMTWRPFEWTDMPLARRVTLAGDAAHAEPPHGGQNLKSGLEDAAMLNDYLTQASLTDMGWGDAVQRYERDMMARALPELSLAEAAAHTVHDFEQIVKGAAVKVDSPMMQTRPLALDRKDISVSL